MARIGRRSAHISVLQRYPKAVAHLWRQNVASRLTPVFGAGASIDIGIPSWPDLVERISQHPAVAGEGIFGTSRTDPLPSVVEVLYQHYKARHYPDADVVHVNPVRESKIRNEWENLIHSCLYQSAPIDATELVSRDAVYQYFRHVITRAPLTITYNFDDSIERMLSYYWNEARERPGGDSGSSLELDYDTITDARKAFRRDTGNILHINGYLPYNHLEGGEGTLVLGDGSFADQLIQSIGGAFSTILHYLEKSTALFVGVSLQDENLRHLLRQSAIMNPGHFHYRIQHVGDIPSPDSVRALSESHFETYNILTLYLTSDEIAALGELISMAHDDLTNVAYDADVNLFYVYYVTGVPGAGKTTTFRHFVSLVAHDQWLGERLPLLSLPFSKLTVEQTEAVDAWVMQQIRSKNRALLSAGSDPGIGIHIIDRCPPDAVTFGVADTWPGKAQKVLSAAKTSADSFRIVRGEVILLTGNPAELKRRAQIRDRQLEATDEFVAWQQNATQWLYNGGATSRDGVRVVNGAEKSVQTVVRAVARIIFLDDYYPCDIDLILRGFKSGAIRPYPETPPTLDVPELQLR